MQTRGGKIGNAGQDVGKPLRLTLLRRAVADEGKHDGGAVGAALGTGECHNRASLSAALLLRGSIRRLSY